MAISNHHNFRIKQCKILLAGVDAGPEMAHHLHVIELATAVFVQTIKQTVRVRGRQAELPEEADLGKNLFFIREKIIEQLEKS